MGNKFIIIANARSGSNWLVHQLNSQPEILSYFELFHPKNNKAFFHVSDKEKCLVDELQKEFRTSKEKFLAKYVFKTTIPASGFKILYHQYQKQYEFLMSYLDDHPEIRIVHLFRQDLIAAYASLRIAIETGKWVRSASNSDQEPIRIDMYLFDYYIRNCIYMENTLRAGDFPWNRQMTHISYEDLIGNPPRVIRDLCKFVGVNFNVELMKEAPQVRQVSEYRPLIINYDEAVTYLRDRGLSDRFGISVNNQTSF